MCGICGVVDRNAGVDVDVLNAMTDTMQHRGPDDRGAWRSSDGTAGLGHRRLSIIDLSPAGHQPMPDATGTLTIILNGEIYNYMELRADLESLGHTFRTHTDTEVLIEAYHRWGAECLKRLRGMFAFAIYDSRRRTLFLARDRAGEKPLFYSRNGGNFVFASELKAIMAQPGFPRRLNPLALNQYLAFGYVLTGQCILEGVSKLPPGHAATYEAGTGHLEIWPYWQLPEPPDTNNAVSDDLLVEEMHELLRDSVRQQLVADVPVGIMLSGGIDSSLVTAMAAEVSSKPVATFNISFPGHGQFDESRFARLVATHFGTNHTELAAEPATVDLLPSLARQYDEPMADSSMVPTYLVSKLIRGQAKVALGGDGGDELFGGYPLYQWVRRQDLVRRLVPQSLRSVVGTAAMMLPRGVRGRNYLIGSARSVAWSLGHASLYFVLPARRKLLAHSGLRVDEAPEQEKPACAVGRTATQRAMSLDFRTYLVEDILVKVDRASMLSSLEVRAPFLDSRIIELAYGRLPDHLRVWKGKRKVLLRKLARRVLPPQLDIDRKQGFSIPLATWFRGKWGTFMRSVLLAADQHLFDQSSIAALITAEEKGLVNSHRIYSLTMFELWRREYRVGL